MTEEAIRALMSATLQPWVRSIRDKIVEDKIGWVDLLLIQPEKVMEPLGLIADPWQVDVLRSSASQKHLCCSRQSGKSQVVSALALLEALLCPPATILLISRALRQASELLRKVKEMWYAVRRFDVRGKPYRPRRWMPIPLKKSQELDKYKDDNFRVTEQTISDNALSMEFDNGSRIISLPGSAESIVGFSAISLLIIDEAARTPDDLYRSVRPMLAVSRGQGGGRLVALSTPYGKRGWFWDEHKRCEEAKAQGDTEPWERYRVKAAQCPRITSDFLAEERLSLGDLWYRQEYEIDFVDTTSSVFAWDTIEQACATDLQELDI